jgi:hypothetical protein
MSKAPEDTEIQKKLRKKETGKLSYFEYILVRLKGKLL